MARFLPDWATQGGPVLLYWRPDPARGVPQTRLACPRQIKRITRSGILHLRRDDGAEAVSPTFGCAQGFRVQLDGLSAVELDHRKNAGRSPLRLIPDTVENRVAFAVELAEYEARGERMRQRRQAAMSRQLGESHD